MYRVRLHINVSVNEIASPKVAQTSRRYFSKIRQRNKLIRELKAIQLENAMLRIHVGLMNEERRHLL